MHSSYTTHNYEDVFRSIVSAYQPTVCVELGVLEGYSSVAIAKGLKENFEKGGGRGHLTAYDLFEGYEFRNSPIARTRDNIEKAGVQDFITLVQQSAYSASEDYQPNSVHLLHVDISNTGDIVRNMMQQWDPKMVTGGIICFEGGTEERDHVEWMVKYSKPSIKNELESNQIIADSYVFATYMRFPGLSCLLKKR